MSDTNLEKVQEQNRKRQKAYYNNHKQEILQKKQTEREQLKEINMPPPPAPIIPTEFTLQMIIDIFTETITNPNTLKKYINDVKRIFKLASISSFNGSLEEYYGIKDSLDNSKYSISTKRGSFQAILVFITNSKIVIDTKVVEKYNKSYLIHTIKYEDLITKRKSEKEHAVIPFTDYLQRILDLFGDQSKEYLIAKMYDELTCRDDLAGLRIIRNIPYDNGTDNILFISEDKECSIILNTYKTSKLYGKTVRVLSNYLSSLLVSYIEKNRLANFLFPDDMETGLSRYILDMNKKVGIDSGINGIRHMKVSEFLQKPDVTAEMRLNFSRGCMHSESTQKKYQRGIIDDSLKEYCN